MFTATATLSLITSDRFNLWADGEEQKYERRVISKTPGKNLATAASLLMITSDRCNVPADGDEQKYEKRETSDTSGKILRSLRPCR